MHRRQEYNFIAILKPCGFAAKKRVVHAIYEDEKVRATSFSIAQ